MKTLKTTFKIIFFLCAYILAWVIEIAGIGFRRIGRKIILKHPMLACEWIADRCYSGSRWLKITADDVVIMGNTIP